MFAQNQPIYFVNFAQHPEFTVTPKQPQAALSKTCSKWWFYISFPPLPMKNHPAVSIQL